MKTIVLQQKEEQTSLDLESMVTDRNLLERLFNQLPCQNLNDVLCLLESEQIESFQDLIDYATGPACPMDLAVTIEAVMDRLRKINLHRDINMSSSSEIGKYMSDKLSGQKLEQNGKALLIGHGYTHGKFSVMGLSMDVQALSLPITIQVAVFALQKQT